MNLVDIPSLANLVGNHPRDLMALRTASVGLDSQMRDFITKKVLNGYMFRCWEVTFQAGHSAIRTSFWIRDEAQVEGVYDHDQYFNGFCPGA